MKLVRISIKIDKWMEQKKNPETDYAYSETWQVIKMTKQCRKNDFLTNGTVPFGYSYRKWGNLTHT